MHVLRSPLSCDEGQRLRAAPLLGQIEILIMQRDACGLIRNEPQSLSVRHLFKIGQVIGQIRIWRPLWSRTHTYTSCHRSQQAKLFRPLSTRPILWRKANCKLGSVIWRVEAQQYTNPDQENDQILDLWGSFLVHEPKANQDLDFRVSQGPRSRSPTWLAFKTAD